MNPLRLDDLKLSSFASRFSWYFWRPSQAFEIGNILFV